MQLTQIEKKVQRSEEFISKIQNLFEKNKEIASKITLEKNQKFVEIEDDLRNLIRMDDWNLYFKSPERLFDNNIFFDQIYFLNSSDLNSQKYVNMMNLFEGDDWGIFNLPILHEENYFVAIHFKHSLDDVSLIELDLLLGLLSRSYLFSSHSCSLIDDDESEFDMLKMIFKHYPWPLGVISEIGEILFYNQNFQNLNVLPSVCLNYGHQEIVEISKFTYQVCRYPIEFDLETHYVFIFYAKSAFEIEDFGRHKEMGIISSSIAHELNNPLAGILAATTMLLSDNDFPNDIKEDLNDLSMSAKRCKDLVQIFLGFSKLTSAPSSLKLKDAFDQAMSLLRFRMVESKIRPDFIYEQQNSAKIYNLNFSIISMTFYLVFSEFLTSLSHRELLLGLSEQNGNESKILIQEFPNCLKLTFLESLDFTERVKNNKLIIQLFEIEKIELVFSKGKMTLSLL